MPRSFKQITHYNDLLIPKEHINKSREMNGELWNQLMRINSAFPKMTIVVEHLLKDFGDEFYSLDMKLKCKNVDVQKHLDAAHKSHMYLPRFRKSDNFPYSLKRDTKAK